MKRFIPAIFLALLPAPLMPAPSLGTGRIFRICASLFFFLVSGLCFQSPAFAGCTTPTGNQGDLIYNGDAHVPQYCNGAHWVPIGQMGGSAPANGLVLYYKFDEGAGTTLTDYSGSGVNGTTNSPTWNTTGKIGGSQTYNGTSQYAVTNSNIDLSGTSAVTVAMWVKQTWSLSASGPQMFEFSENYNSYTDTFGIWQGDVDCTGGSVANRGIMVVIHGNGTSQSPNGYNEKCFNAPSDNSWHHLVAIFDTSQPYTAEVMLYIDGAPQTMINQPYINENTNSFGVHQFYLMDRGGVSDWNPGTIDEFRVYNRALSAAEISNLYRYTAPLGGGAAPTAGLAGWWKLDEGSGTSAADSSGNGNTGTLVNSPTWTTSGKINDALTFDGTSQYVDTANIADNLSNFTVSAWFKTTTIEADQGGIIISKLTAPGIHDGTGWALLMGGPSDYPGTIQGLIQNAPGDAWCQPNSTAVLNDGQWHFATMVVTGGNAVTMYLDGSSSGFNNATCQGTLTDYSNTSNVRIGSDDGGEYFSGSLDDVRIYNRALTAQEVTSLYYYTGPAGCAGPTGYGGDMLYNQDYHVLQYCDGTNWRSSGFNIDPQHPTGPGGGCSSPSGIEGDTIFDKKSLTLQYCDGGWITVGGSGAPTNGMVLYHKFDETSGTTAADSSGSNNTSTLVNSPTWTTSGKINGALTFDGSTQGAETNSTIDLTGTKAVTVSLWMNRTYGTFTGTSDSAIITVFSVHSNYNNNTFYMADDDHQDCGSGVISIGAHGTGTGTNWNNYCYANPSSGVWHHIAAVFDNTQSTAADEVKLYIDGVQQTPISTISNTLLSNYFGNYNLYTMYTNYAGGGTSTWHNNGTIDDLRIYNRALSAGEVMQLYNVSR